MFPGFTLPIFKKVLTFSILLNNCTKVFNIIRYKIIIIISFLFTSFCTNFYSFITSCFLLYIFFIPSYSYSFLHIILLFHYFFFLLSLIFPFYPVVNPLLFIFTINFPVVNPIPVFFYLIYFIIIKTCHLILYICTM